jgi:signal peptidase I
MSEPTPATPGPATGSGPAAESVPPAPGAGPTPLPPPAAPAPPAHRGGGRRANRSATRNALEWILVIVGAVVVALLIKTYLVQAFRIPSESMDPTLLNGDRVLVNKLSYRLHDVNRGDVVVFRRPEGLPGGPGQPEDLIKRVVALPGETVVAREGVVYVDGRLLDEPYLSAGSSTTNLDRPVVLGPDEVFVMGDNRGNSQDGRVFGPIAEDTIIGRAFLVTWPPGRLSTL